MGSGFIAIIALSWLGELFHSLGEPEGSLHVGEALTETGIVIAIAVPSLVLLRRSLARVDYLEHLLSMCAWCRRVKYEGNWISLSDFFKLKLRIETTHGICTSCLEKEHEDLAKRRELKVS